jgi:hypothetical protein
LEFSNKAGLFLKISLSFFFETGAHYIVQAVLELMILLPQLLKCWNYRGTPPCLAANVF